MHWKKTNPVRNSKKNKCFLLVVAALVLPGDALATCQNASSNSRPGVVTQTVTVTAADGTTGSVDLKKVNDAYDLAFYAHTPKGKKELYCYMPAASSANTRIALTSGANDTVVLTTRSGEEEAVRPYTQIITFSSPGRQSRVILYQYAQKDEKTGEKKSCTINILSRQAMRNGQPFTMNVLSSTTYKQLGQFKALNGMQPCE